MRSPHKYRNANVFVLCIYIYIGIRVLKLALCVIIIIYFLADALIQGDLQLLQDITLFFYIQFPIYTVVFLLEQSR